MATIGGLVLVGVSAGEETASMLSRDVKFGIVLGVPVLALVGAVAKRMRHSIALASLAGLAFTASALAARAVRIRGQSVAHILTSPLAWAVLLYAFLLLFAPMAAI
ncbi:MAG TPA: hypothetical protein PLV68_21130, partial [Ilumatobacteraceae bacterium]|nr:hypothetical protein [Ilumatobacteraceae bacterium]